MLVSSGYLACDGSLYDTYQYPALFTIGYTYGPLLGTIVPHQNEEIITANYIYQINQDDVKSFVTGPKPFQLPSSSFNYSNGLASISYNPSYDTINAGNTETFPVHTSIQYFIKY